MASGVIALYKRDARYWIAVAAGINVRTGKDTKQQELIELDRQLLKYEGEPEICKQFGCGRALTIREKLFGNKCQSHSK